MNGIKVLVGVINPGYLVEMIFLLNNGGKKRICRKFWRFFRVSLVATMSCKNDKGHRWVRNEVVVTPSGKQIILSEVLANTGGNREWVL